MPPLPAAVRAVDLESTLKMMAFPLNAEAYPFQPRLPVHVNAELAPGCWAATDASRYDDVPDLHHGDAPDVPAPREPAGHREPA
eukprot:3264222-Pyramimonas_sp.AAC.1